MSPHPHHQASTVSPRGATPDGVKDVAGARTATTARAGRVSPREAYIADLKAKGFHLTHDGPIHVEARV